MRMILAAALAFGLSGCADSNFVEHPITSLFGGGESQPAAAGAETQSAAQPGNVAPQPVSAATAAHCGKLAKQRAGDAAFEGEDSDTQRSVYDSTYAGCVDWDVKHRSNG